MNDLTEKQKLIKKINQAKHILLAISERPSGDQIGSILALREGLIAKNKNIFSVFGGQLDDNYNFIDDLDKLSTDLAGSKDFILAIKQNGAQADHLGYKLEEGELKITITPAKGNFKPNDVSYQYGDYQYDLIITLGVTELKQLGSAYNQDPEIFYKTETINIDNNPKNQQFGEINWLDNQASSLAEMMVGLLESLDINLDKKISTYLLMSLMSATDRFQAQNTTSKALTVAAQLIGAGANRDYIVNSLYKETPYTYLKGWGRIMENLNIDTTLNFAWSSLSQEEITSLKINQEAINQALDKLLVKTKEANIIALIQESDKGAKVSLRSSGKIDVSKLANEYDGGGQEGKAGFELRGDFSELKKKAIRLVKDYLKENI
jgi:phosphoesterase RecJ-like protein